MSTQRKRSPLFLPKWEILVVGFLFLVGSPFAVADNSPASAPTSRASSLSAVPTSRRAKRVAVKKRAELRSTAKKGHANPASSTSQKILVRKRLLNREERRILSLRRFLRAFLMKHGREPDNPWLLIHSLLVFGSGLRLADGKLVIPHIVKRYGVFQKVDRHWLPFFPAGSKEARIEPHPFMFMKTFLETGFPVNKTLTTGKKSFSLKQLVLASRSHSKLSLGQSGKRLAHMSWLLFAYYKHLPRADWSWKTEDGKGKEHLSAIIKKAFQYLNQSTAFMFAMQSQKLSIIQKKRQGIYKLACGGFHFLQTTFRWMGHPYFRASMKGTLSKHIDLLFYRLDAESRLYLSLLKKYKHDKSTQFLLLRQQLKFVGHWLETIVKLHKWWMFQPSSVQKKKVRYALRLLMVTTMMLNRLGAFSQIQRIKQAHFQSYLDLLGDSAHALFALRYLSDHPFFLPSR